MTASLTYILQSIPWALVGLLVGVFLGRAIVAADTITDAITDTADHQHGPERGDIMSNPDPPGRPRRRWWRRLRQRLSGNTVIVCVFVALALVTAVQAYVQGEVADRQAQETQRLTECLKDYANDVADALDARSSATGQAQESLDKFIGAVSTATPDVQGRDLVRRALDVYLQTRKSAKQAQAANPFPPAPRDVCQDAG